MAKGFNWEKATYITSVASFTITAYSYLKGGIVTEVDMPAASIVGEGIVRTIPIDITQAAAILFIVSAGIYLMVRKKHKGKLTFKRLWHGI